MIAVDLVQTGVLALKVAIEAEHLLPLHHGQGGIQRIQVCDLDVAGVFILIRAGLEWIVESTWSIASAVATVTRS